jgi:hypothetical protein
MLSGKRKKDYAAESAAEALAAQAMALGVEPEDHSIDAEFGDESSEEESNAETELVAA